MISEFAEAKFRSSITPRKFWPFLHEYLQRWIKCHYLVLINQIVVFIKLQMI